VALYPIRYGLALRLLQAQKKRASFARAAFFFGFPAPWHFFTPLF
jgi:hypothetical protein